MTNAYRTNNLEKIDISALSNKIKKIYDERILGGVTIELENDFKWKNADKRVEIYWARLKSPSSTLSSKSSYVSFEDALIKLANLLGVE